MVRTEASVCDIDQQDFGRQPVTESLTDSIPHSVVIDFAPTEENDIFRAIDTFDLAKLFD